MISKQWRHRLIYAAMSIFLGWHTLAMVIAPAPEQSDLVRSLRGMLQPYLSFFKLDNHWDFFAPNIGGNSVFRYVLKDSTGVDHTFTPMRNWSWFSPTSLWFHDWYDALMDEPEVYGDIFATLLCREHADLRPVSIVLQAVEEQEFWPEDLLKGKHPIDPEFVEVQPPIASLACPAQ